MNNQVATALKTLGFTKPWLTQGILTESLLMTLYHQFQTSEDKNQEHYRWQAFTQYLGNKTTLTDAEVAVCFRLQDGDLCDLQKNRIFAVLHSNLLSAEQLQALADKHSFMNEKPFKTLYQRLLIMQRMQHGLSDAIFHDIKQSQDTALYRMAVEDYSVTKEQLLWLSLHANKKVRNMAKNKLNKFKL